MRNNASLRKFVLILWVLFLASVPSADAVRLDSSGTNDEYIGVANYAYSYSSVPYTLSAYCYLDGADDSSWEAPSSCDSSGDYCWATSCTYPDCEPPNPTNADAYLSMNSMRKALLRYYARDHKDDGQGYCDFYIGSTNFQTSFEYRDTGVDFTLSLIVTDATDDDTWRPNGTTSLCPTADYPSEINAYPQTYVPDTAAAASKNTICNEDFVISLSADPDVSNGAMLSVVNNPYGLQQAVQEAPVTSTSEASTTRQGTTRSPTEGRRRLASRKTSDGHWLIVSDSEGEEIDGLLMTSSSPESVDDTIEMASCSLKSDDGNPDPVLRQYNYSCVFKSLDGTSTRTQQLMLPGVALRARPLQGPAPVGPASPTRSGVVGLVNRAVRDFAKDARVGTPGNDGRLVWHGSSEGARVMMVRHAVDKEIEIVTHSPDAVSPSFMSCSQTAQDERNLDYACRANLRCTGTPCPPESWSPGSLVQFPRALFKSRPCPSGQGVTPSKTRLRLSRLGGWPDNGRLRYLSRVEFPRGTSVRPDRNGFRLLVEDGDGDTVVDLDIPGNGQADRHHAKKRNRWRVRKGGTSFRFHSLTPIGGMVPSIEIERSSRHRNEWEVNVLGRKGIFDQDDISLPLRASITLNPTDPNANVCSRTEFPAPGEVGDCRVRKMGSAITCR
ncbi:hypothetical protein MK489_22375 [Myxococcota bacterium]|nr:hypothetical protein [Myxococcota bacterium]